MTRARAKLLGQQVNSLLIECDVCDNENFILPKSMHLCMIRVVDNTHIGGGPEKQQGLEYNVTYGAREEREACAKKEDEEIQAAQPEAGPSPARLAMCQKPPASNSPEAGSGRPRLAHHPKIPASAEDKAGSARPRLGMVPKRPASSPAFNPA